MLSVVILTKNSEKNITVLINSLRQADEIIIVDDNSTDKTAVMVNQLLYSGSVKAKLFTRSLNNDFAAQRNFGQEKTKGDWTLFVDADEEVSKELMNEIIQLINNPIIITEGYFIGRRDELWGKMMTGTEAGKSKILRLIKRGKGKWVRQVHEYIIPPLKTGVLKNSLIHKPHPTLWKFIKDINYYSTIHAEENHREHKRSSILKIIFYPIVKLFYNWIVLRGYKDGSRGFVVSLMMSLHSFLSWSKLWLIQ